MSEAALTLQADLAALNARINALLPALYVDCYEQVEPDSMGSAGLTFDAAGRVAWDEIWTTFCDLALAGGPPHRGTLLEPAGEAEAAQAPDRYDAVVQEIGRGLHAVTGLPVLPGLRPGWIGVRCQSVGMAAWLTRAIVVENVTARHERDMLLLPAGPAYRLAREIKNVVVALAKTCHYWTAHMEDHQRAALETSLALTSEALLQPATAPEVEARSADYRAVIAALEQGIVEQAGLARAARSYAGWVGAECADVNQAIWLARALVASNILARWEGAILFLPAHPSFLTTGVPRLVSTLARAVVLHAAR